jgi:hypothetical protein
MGTTKQTNQASQFAPTGMQAYNQLQGPFANVTTGYMTDPFGNPFFKTQQQLGTRQAQNIGGTNLSNLMRNFQTGGVGGGTGTLAPFQSEQLANQMRANTGLQAQLGFLQPVMNALGLQQSALGMAENYRPLQTGQKTTESTGGLGTWLPQVAGMALGGLTGMPFMGGMFGGGGGSGMPAGGTQGMMDTAMGSFNAANPYMGTGYGGGFATQPAFMGGLGGGGYNFGGGPMAPPPALP